MLDYVHRARSRGYATQMERFVPGTSTIALPVPRATQPGILGVLSVAGPVGPLVVGVKDKITGPHDFFDILAPFGVAIVGMVRLSPG